MIGRLRLIDAVVIAAVAVLGLKVIALIAGPKPAEHAAAAAGPDGLPSFGRAIAYARTNYLPPDVTETGSAAAKKEEKPEPPPEPPKPKPPGFEPAPPPPSPAERALLERLGERRDELQQRSSDLEMRERLIENAEKKLEGRINELKTIEGKSGEEAKRGDTDAAALKNLVVMYEAMKPKDAARVFDRLTLDVLVPVVIQMKPAKMADVLSAMSPQAAEKLTVALAMRARGKAAPEASAAPAGPTSPNELQSIDQPPRPRS